MAEAYDFSPFSTTSTSAAMVTAARYRDSIGTSDGSIIATIARWRCHKASISVGGSSGGSDNCDAIPSQSRPDLSRRG